MRGTLLNTATVAAGAGLGWVVGDQVPIGYKAVAMGGLGLVCLGLGVKMFLQSRNVLVVAAAVAVGGMLGLLVGIHAGLESLSNWARGYLGGGEKFTETFVTTSVLFCVGPMTLLGCLQDGLERRIELLSIKSTLDGIGAFFFAAAASGPPVLLTALVVLVFQGFLTLGARYLKGLATDETLISEATAAGGLMMVSIGLGLLELKQMQTANYLPSLVLAPLFAALARRLFSSSATTADP